MVIRCGNIILIITIYQNKDWLWTISVPNSSETWCFLGYKLVDCGSFSFSPTVSRFGDEFFTSVCCLGIPGCLKQKNLFCLGEELCIGLAKHNSNHRKHLPCILKDSLGQVGLIYSLRRRISTQQISRSYTSTNDAPLLVVMQRKLEKLLIWAIFFAPWPLQLTPTP